MQDHFLGSTGRGVCALGFEAFSQGSVFQGQENESAAAVKAALRGERPFYNVASAYGGIPAKLRLGPALKEVLRNFHYLELMGILFSYRPQLLPGSLPGRRDPIFGLLKRIDRT